MPSRIQFADDIEPLVQFIEETPRSEILDRTLEKLRAGVPTKTMLTASALAVTRSSDLPPGHHGGPLHPVAGLYALSKLVERRGDGDDRFLPVLQHVALANKHINDPATGPFQLLDFSPLDAEGGAMTAEEDMARDGGGDVAKGRGVEATKEAFLKSVNRGESNKADHYFIWLWQNVPHIEAFDLLMSVAIPKNSLDDHYFIYPASIWRAVQSGTIDAKYMPVLMRQAVRYVTRFPTTRSLPDIDALIEEHGLLGRILRQRTGDDETAKIGEIGEAIGQCNDYNVIPRLLAQALVDGLSLEGAGEALSIGAASLFLRSMTGNPMDVHLHTSANLRRYLLRLDGLSMKNKLLVLLLWQTGPEVKSTQFRMEPVTEPVQPAIDALPHRSQADLLDTIAESIYTQPPTDWASVSNLGRMRAVPEVKNTVNLARQYVQLGYSAEALIQRLGDIVCHDSFTEMHSFKHHNAIVEEFYATREPWRWLHLVSGCQAAAISFGKNMEVYEGALELMHAA